MSARACPICARPFVSAEYAPFCSRRCADVDLQRWFSGAYAVPAAEAEGDGGEATSEAGRLQDDPL